MRWTMTTIRITSIPARMIGMTLATKAGVATRDTTNEKPVTTFPFDRGCIYDVRVLTVAYDS